MSEAKHTPRPCNARLIAAAPDLLEACLRIARTSPVVRQADFDFLRAAITKAGEDPLEAFRE